MRAERKKRVLPLFTYKGTNLMRALPLLPNYLSKALHWGLGFNIQILEGHKSVSSQQCIIILNVYVPNNRASKYMKKKNNALKGEQADL